MLQFMSFGIIFRFIALLAFMIFPLSQAHSDQVNGKPLKVAVYNIAPYVNSEEAGMISGHSVRLWTLVAAELKKPFELKLEKTVDSIFEGLKNETFDVAIGALTVTPLREEQVDFSHPTHPSGVAVAIKKSEGFSSAVQVLLSTIIELMPLLLLVAGLIFAAGFASWRLEKSYALKTPNMPTNISTLGEGIYWAAVTMTTVGYGDKTPKSSRARALTVIWMFVGIVVISIFSGTVTAKLTATQFVTLEGSETALRLQKFGAVQSSSGAEFLTNSNRKFQPFDTLDAALSALKAGEIEAVFNSRGALVHHVQGPTATSLEVLHTDLTRGWMAFALPPNSPNKKAIDQALLRVLASRAWAAEREIMAREYSNSNRPDRTTF